VEELASGSKIAETSFKELLAFDGFIIGGNKNFGSEFIRSVSKGTFVAIWADKTKLISFAVLRRRLSF
jgi:hypothetical protein